MLIFLFFLALSPILNIGHGNKYAVFLITLVEIACIVVATHVIIDKKEKAICKVVCSKWKSSLSKIIFSMCALKFVEDTFDIATNIDTSIFWASSVIIGTIQFCIDKMDRKIEEWQD